MSKTIKRFSGQYAFLSNFYECHVKYEGLEYRNSEAAFQANKTLDPEKRKAFTDLDGAASKKAGRKLKLRADWNDVKDDVMYQVCRAKFEQNPALLQQLKDTGDAELIEGTMWHDSYWGVDLTTGKGENHLGVILMKIRTEL